MPVVVYTAIIQVERGLNLFSVAKQGRTVVEYVANLLKTRAKTKNVNLWLLCISHAKVVYNKL